MTKNSTHGGPRKNAGRKSKAEKMLLAGFSAPWFTAELQRTKWSEFVHHDDPKIALDAIKYLSNRIYGMPTQAVDNKHSGDIGLQIVSSIPRPERKMIS